MDSEIYRLLYTDKEGHQLGLFEVSLLDDDEVPWERVSALEDLVARPGGEHDIQVRLQAARLLAAWGNDAGLEFLEWFVAQYSDHGGVFSPHRLRNYDVVLEEVLESVLNFWARHADRGEVDGKSARTRIEGVVKNIVRLSGEYPFEIAALYSHLMRVSWLEYLDVLKEHFDQVIGNPVQHDWKVADCIKVLDRYAPGYVEHVLQRHGKSRANYAGLERRS